MLAELLEAFTVGKTHGLDGSLRIFSLSGETKHLKKIKSVLLKTKEQKELNLIVDKVSLDGTSLLMRFQGYNTPEEARKLTGSTGYIKRSDAIPLKKGEYYIADLYNMDIIYKNKKVGVVYNTMEGGQSILLMAKNILNDKEYLIPLLPVYVSNVDINKNTLELLYPELLEIKI